MGSPQCDFGVNTLGLANPMDAQFNKREKAFCEMKKDVGMTTAQKSKETRRMEMGSIFVLYIQPTIPTYTYIATL